MTTARKVMTVCWKKYRSANAPPRDAGCFSKMKSSERKTTAALPAAAAPVAPTTSASIPVSHSKYVNVLKAKRQINTIRPTMNAHLGKKKKRSFDIAALAR
jgi:hypothetical protein